MSNHNKFSLVNVTLCCQRQLDENKVRVHQCRMVLYKRQIYLKRALPLTMRALLRLFRSMSCLHNGVQGKPASQARLTQHLEVMHLPLPLSHSSLKLDQSVIVFNPANMS